MSAAAAPSSNENASSRKVSAVRPKMSLTARVAQLDAEYRALLKSKKVAHAPSLTSVVPRFEKERSVSAELDRSTIGTIGHTGQVKKEKSSSWAKSTAPMRPEPAKPACDKFYDPADPSTVQRRNQVAVFRSRSPRFDTDSVLSSRPPPSESPLSLYSAFAAVANAKKVPFACMRSKSPRLQPAAEAACDKFYNNDQTTIAHDVATSKFKGNSWSKSKVPMREAIKPPACDKYYDPVDPNAVKPVAAKAAFASHSDRFELPKPRAPDPGTYASKFVSCGMLP